jgi:hypothetical protein
MGTLERSFQLLNAFRGAARYHAKLGMLDKAKDYRKQAIEQLKDFEMRLIAVEECRAFDELGFDSEKRRHLFSAIRSDAKAYAALLESGKFPGEEPNKSSPSAS